MIHRRILPTLSLPLAVAGALWALAGAPAQAADPFYVNLLAAGVESLELGEVEPAVQKLRIACFGFLEEPPLLAEGLAWLALAQKAAGDLESFRGTFDRLVELEEELHGYREAALSATAREQLEAAILLHIPERTLQGSPFEPLLVRKAEAALATLPTRQRREALEERAASFPQDPRWSLQLAALEIEEGRWDEALQWADRAAALGEELPCVRLMALSGMRRDAEAVAAVAGCQQASGDAALTAAALESWVRLDRWTEATDYLATVEPAVLAEPKVARLAKKVQRKAPDEVAALAASAEPAEDLAGESVEDEEEDRAATPAASLGEDQEAALQRAREILRSARRVEELQAAAALAEPIADGNPSHREAQQLAGEIAYRAARWAEAAAYFRRAGDPGESRPALLFYMAVSFYESGDHAAAREAMERCLPRLHRTPYVDRYVARILGEG